MSEQAFYSQQAQNFDARPPPHGGNPRGLKAPSKTALLHRVAEGYKRQFLQRDGRLKHWNLIPVTRPGELPQRTGLGTRELFKNLVHQKGDLEEDRRATLEN